MMPYELTPQDKDVLSDYPDWVPPKVPPPGCPCNRYTSCKECVEAQPQDTTGLTENQILCRNVTIGVKEARKEFLIRQDEREKVLNELKSLIGTAKEEWSQQRITMFHYTGLYCMIESLRTKPEGT